MEVTFKAYDMRHVWQFKNVVSGNLIFREIRRIASTAIIIDVKKNDSTQLRIHKNSRIRKSRFKSIGSNGRYARTKQSELTRQVGKPAVIRFKMPRTIQKLVRANDCND